MVRWLGTLLGVGCCPQPINQVHVFYAAMSEMGSGFRPVEAVDAYEAERDIQCESPGFVRNAQRAGNG